MVDWWGNCLVLIPREILMASLCTAGVSELCVKVGTLSIVWTKGLYMCIYVYTYAYTEPTTVSAFDVLKVK